MYEAPFSNRYGRPVQALLAALLVAATARADTPLSSPGQAEIENQNTVEPGARLDRKAVKDFVVTVFEAADILADDHIKEVSRQQLVEWAIRGLYRHLDEKIPPGQATR